MVPRWYLFARKAWCEEVKAASHVDRNGGSETEGDRSIGGPKSEGSYGTGHTIDRTPESAISILCVPVFSWPVECQPCSALNMPSLERQYVMIGLN